MSPGILSGLKHLAKDVVKDVEGIGKDVVKDAEGAVKHAVKDLEGIAKDVVKDLEGSGEGLGKLKEGGDDPVGDLLSGPISFLIDHVSFLREPFNYVTGDPDAISKHGNDLKSLSQQLDSMAKQRQQGLVEVKVYWQGASAEAYQQCGGVQADAITAASKAASNLSVKVLKAGDLIGDARSEMLSLVSDAIAGWISDGLIALAEAPETFGCSIAEFIVEAVEEAVEVGSQLADIIQKTSDFLAELKTSVATLGSLMDALSGLLGQDRSGGGSH